MVESVIPVQAQIAVVHKMVLPLLLKMGIDCTVTTNPKGMRLDIKFEEPAAPEAEPTLGTDTPEHAAQLWAVRERIEQYRRDHPELSADAASAAAMTDAE